MALRVALAGGVSEVDPGAWDRLVPDGAPFLEHRFLAHLERSRAVGRGTGWLPRPALVFAGAELVAAAPSYVKTQSYGEYIFDFHLAHAAERAGLRYYPKIVVAVPFTPATGPRLLARDDDARAALLDGLEGLRREVSASSLHVLFPTDAEARWLEGRGLLRRATHQYHFRNPGYRDFDDFLGALRAEHRKNIKKERRRIAEAGVEIELVTGAALRPEHFEAIERFYRRTVDEKGGQAYLPPAFWATAAEALRETAVIVLARRGGAPIGGSLSFQRGPHLYGRHFGADEAVDGLHFEVCYYRLIEHAIATRKTLFEAGAQGSHKIKRGFLPVVTHSAHSFDHKGLSRAAAEAFRVEAEELAHALPGLASRGPFREDAAPPFPLVAGIELPPLAEAGP